MTDGELAAFMITVLGKTGEALDMTGASFDHVLDDVKEADSDEGQRKLARMWAWRTALDEATALYDFSDASLSLKRSQIFDHIDKQLGFAITDALPFTSSKVEISRMVFVHDPYKAEDVDE